MCSFGVRFALVQARRTPFRLSSPYSTGSVRFRRSLRIRIKGERPALVKKNDTVGVPYCPSQQVLRIMHPNMYLFFEDPPPGGNRHVRMIDGWAPLPPGSVQMPNVLKFKLTCYQNSVININKCLAHASTYLLYSPTPIELSMAKKAIPLSLRTLTR
jgi:hypothetical protein